MTTMLYANTTKWRCGGAGHQTCGSVMYALMTGLKQRLATANGIRQDYQ